MADVKDNGVDPHAIRTLDTQLANRGVWLVKVPKYLAEKMKGANGPVGKIKTHIPSGGGAPEVLFCLNDNIQSATDTVTPTTHKFIMSTGFNLNLTVLGESETRRLTADGKVIQRMECRPHGDSKYMQYKKQQLEDSNKPKREIISLEKPVNTYKPVNTHAFIAEYEAQKKADGKRSRDDADKVKEMLFRAFEKHQYYSLRDLHTLTKQPLTHLKDILKDICKYNLRAPHKNMYELKSEYRHYTDNDN